MKRRWMTALWGALVLATSCQVEQTAQTTQELTSDCVPGGNFPYAKMPIYKMWDLSPPPTPSATGSFVVFQLASGDWLAALAETGSGKITWAVEVKNVNLDKLLANLSARGQIDVPRVPPHPNPGGTDDVARVILEYALRSQAQWNYAFDAAGATRY